MSAHVVKHISFRPKAFPAAVGASKGSSILMNPAMNVQILLLTESLSTAWKGTFVRLCPIMEVRVGIESDFTAENFFTAREGAGEVLLLPF